MTGFVVGADEGEFCDRVARLGALEGKSADELLEARRDHWLIGTPEQIAERLGDDERAGVERIALRSSTGWTPTSMLSSCSGANSPREASSSST